MSDRRWHFSLAVLTVICITLSAVTRVHGGFTPPKDGKLTEKQVNGYLASVEGQSQVEMENDELLWISGQAGPLWQLALDAKQWEEKAKPAIEAQLKARDAESSTAKARLVEYQQAQKDGIRVLTKEQREAAVTAATVDRDKITGEVKTDQDAVKPISQEIALHEKEDADAEALAKNPPDTVAANDRTVYIDARKNEAQAASDAAQNARDRLKKEAEKNLDDAKTRLTLAQARVDHPEIPQAGEASVLVKEENKATVKADQKTIQDNDRSVSLLKPMLNPVPTDSPDADNLALLKKQTVAYLNAIGAGNKPGVK